MLKSLYLTLITYVVSWIYDTDYIDKDLQLVTS